MENTFTRLIKNESRCMHLRKKIGILFFLLMLLPVSLRAQAPSISSFTPITGPVGTLVTVTGANLGSPTSFSMGGVTAITVSASATQLVGMIMPGSVSGKISVSTAGGSTTSSDDFTVTVAKTPNTQQGTVLADPANASSAYQGWSSSISADGNTVIMGGYGDNGAMGAAWIYSRTGNTWTQQGSKLVGTGNVGLTWQGLSVDISADGNTAIVGGCRDNSFQGAAWIFTRSGDVWTQQGAKLVGTGNVGAAYQGQSVSISADGNTVLIGGAHDNATKGAVWVFTRTAGVWSQLGSKLVGTGTTGSIATQQGIAVSLSADGKTAIIGGNGDGNAMGAAWIFTLSGSTWTQQGAKLVGTGAVPWVQFSTNYVSQGLSVCLSADGNTAIIGGTDDAARLGAAWIFTRTAGVWSQQGNKLVGAGYVTSSVVFQGTSVSLSADGNAALIGGNYDASGTGAAWLFSRSAGVWSQTGSKIVGTGGSNSYQGQSVSLSSDGLTSVVGGNSYNSGKGGGWIFTPLQPPAGLSYTPATNTLVKNKLYVQALPSSTGGSISSYTISPALPTGVSINATTGVILGIPTVISDMTVYTITATNAEGSTTGTYSLKVTDALPVIIYSNPYTGAPIPLTAYKDMTITNVVPGSYGGAVVSYSISPALPAGLSFNTTTGVISGTPTETSPKTTYTIIGTNSGGTSTATKDITVIEMIAPSNLVYTPSSLIAINGYNISNVVPSSEGTAPASYSIIPSLPAGLSLNTTTGIISGKPTEISAETAYTITATNLSGNTTGSFILTVKNDDPPTALVYTPAAVIGTKGQALTNSVPSISGGAVISYRVDPALPAGVILNTSTGIINGNPIALNNLTVYTITATNSGGSTTSDFTLTVNDVAPTDLSYAPASLIATFGTMITDVTPSSDGGIIINYVIHPALPAGLSLNTLSGIISGTPDALQLKQVDYTITATNTGGSTTTNFSLTINDIAPAHLSYSPSEFVAINGNTINDIVPVSDGGAVVSYEINPELPAGLNINASTGVISGTPTGIADIATYSVTAVNSGGNTTGSLTLTIKNDDPPTSLSYTPASLTASLGETMDPIVPASNGGSVKSYSIVPALPSGLNFNTLTGSIGGAPTEILTETVYTITATNSGGNTTADFTLAVIFTAPLANSSQKVCGNGTVNNLEATVSAGNSIRWYIVETGGSPLNAATALVNGTTYYAETWNNVFASQTRTAVLLTLNQKPAKPVIVVASNSITNSKLCPDDYLVCTNFDNTLLYQWYQNNIKLDGQTSSKYQVKENGAGDYAITVINDATGCSDSSSVTTISAIYETTVPVIYEKKLSNAISILIVDNKENLYSHYDWSYSDGTTLPSDMVNGRQFLVLPLSKMNASYTVNIADTNTCKVSSAFKVVTPTSVTMKIYPTLNDGNFSLYLGENSGSKIQVKIHTNNGITLKTYEIENSGFENEYQIKASGLAPGTYLIEVSSGEFRETQRIIIQ